ncbi:MAG TPA: hypothetical protein VGV63_09235 [Acidimicrobiales bacterium]|nr:hypothetical protein [Acidimicrobiales bacterium]
MVRKLVAGAGICVGLIGGMAAPAFAFYCSPQDKPAGAGAVDFDKVQEPNPGGQIVAPGAFVDHDGQDVFIRGGDHKGGHQSERQFGAIHEQALDKGNPDHGLTHTGRD